MATTPSKGFPRAGKNRQALTFFANAQTWTAATSYYIAGTTTDNKGLVLGFPFRVVGFYASFPAQTDNVTGTLKIYRNTNSGTNDEVMTITLTDSGGADMTYSTTTVVDQGCDVFDSDDGLIVEFTPAAGTNMTTPFSCAIAIEPGEA